MKKRETNIENLFEKPKNKFVLYRNLCEQMKWIPPFGILFAIAGVLIDTYLWISEK